MKYCTQCVMPDTRPGITFDDGGVCIACRNFERRKEIDWGARMAEFRALCERYRGINGPHAHDCAVAASGGKDSHYQVYVLKELMGMNPILFTVEDNFPMTEAGKHNLRNIGEEFGCEVVALKPNARAQKALMRKTFERYGKPTWYIDRLIYTYPLHMALKFNTALLCYGENVAFEYGGADAVETYSARAQLQNGVASDIPHGELLGDGVTERELHLTNAPSKEELDRLDPMYLSYFMPWNSFQNYQFAKSRGFHDLQGEWNRAHHVENFDQVDSRAYLVHSWMKYPKFGHQTATDYAARYVRYGLWTRERAIEAVRAHDHNLDPQSVRDFCQFTGYSESEFWAIVDRFYNREIFHRDAYGRWALNDPIR